uniref:Uncharacterized protein n=1 Tax=Ananas comosus var. bracteatus TaxID=296719 RepID=A0A6V7PXN8_ANACO|nr:unnamed protein product [Ananas comosus var. bracteatus]
MKWACGSGTRNQIASGARPRGGFRWRAARGRGGSKLPMVSSGRPRGGSGGERPAAGVGGFELPMLDLAEDSDGDWLVGGGRSGSELAMLGLARRSDGERCAARGGDGSKEPNLRCRDSRGVWPCGRF